jgi:alpha-tubulin suppressor-like RCC1 family protein
MTRRPFDLALACAVAAFQRGDGTTIDRERPVAVKGLGPVAAAGAAHTCALTTEGAVWRWGELRRGQVGNGLFGYRQAPATLDRTGP